MCCDVLCVGVACCVWVCVGVCCYTGCVMLRCRVGVAWCVVLRCVMSYVDVGVVCHVAVWGVVGCCCVMTCSVV